MAGQKLKIQKTVIISTPVKEEAIAVRDTKESVATKGGTVTANAKTAVAANTDADNDTETDDVAVNTATDTKVAIVAKEVTKRPKEINYEQERMYIVQKGDSLFSIARKHPGVTVENLKNWNKIQGESIQPGMKLKVIEVN